ncbi:Glucuronate isomerase [Paenibacillus curdlanolyticus YK9]|uniref:Uronate isomerase n=1 Tax=Paenibacillus curdlanolyticus YK9 TaxID=717606 RepID=E0IEW8_9BACL|nr:glucuronate isomerase [Paenibacillus curdlanolyticus]EFM09206.1 Glucuronate isomerase [Paenibacillus curdlanolyticus YK9]
MKPFLNEQFLLCTETSVRLYEQHAKALPIIDYHCHLSPQEIFENKRFNNLTEAWLNGDHYKWRAMRANGVSEHLVTGPADDYERFLAYAGTVPMAIGNPLYHWSHLELQRYFGVHELINEKNAPAIWHKVNKQLSGDGFGARDLIRKSKVKVICTTDDPVDSLEYHIKLRQDGDFNDVKVLPSFRPDKALELNRDSFIGWISQLSDVVGSPIESYEQLLGALDARIAFFHETGCRVSDHAIDVMMYADSTLEEASAAFAAALRGKQVSKEAEARYKTFTLLHIGRRYAEHGWAMQLHINAARNNNPRSFRQLGPDTGFDSINDSSVAYGLVHLLGGLAADDKLPRTILYSLNPSDYYPIGTIMGSFQGGGIPGKIQLGAAWWFNDSKDGMNEQMKTLANLGLLSRFVGMLTDSRSFLSYTRHEYFRRILCDLLGEWVENGEAPDDDELLGRIIRGICYENAVQYFNFE